MEKEIYVGEFDFSKILHPIFLVINAIRLRIPICEKKKCKIPIKRKEAGEIGIEVPFEDKLIRGVPVKICRFVFEIEGEEVSIEIKREIFENHSEGDKLPIEYLNGSDRIHARIKP
jgi:hypothetical protein